MSAPHIILARALFTLWSVVSARCDFLRSTQPRVVADVKGLALSSSPASISLPLDDDLKGVAATASSMDAVRTQVAVGPR